MRALSAATGCIVASMAITALLWYLRAAMAAAAQRRQERAMALAARDAVVRAVLGRLQAGRPVSDVDVASLVEETGAPVETVFQALDLLAGRRSA